MTAFGIHSGLWSFLRTLIDLQEEQECEEMLYEVGGKKPATRRAVDIRKESELSTLKDIFVQSPQPVPLDVAIEYVKSISYKMRQYNNIDNHDADDDGVIL